MTYADLQPQHFVGLSATLQHGRHSRMAHWLPLLRMRGGFVASGMTVNPLKLLRCCAVAATGGCQEPGREI